MLDWTILGVRLNNPGGRWRWHWSSDWLPRSVGKQRRRAWRAALEALPYAATVHLPSGGRVGLIHAAGWLHSHQETSWDLVCGALARLRQLGTLGDDNALIFRDRAPKGRHYTARPG